MRELVRTKGYRYRDMAVITNFRPYDHIAKAVKQFLPRHVFILQKIKETLIKGASRIWKEFKKAWLCE